MERLLQQVRATHTHYCCGGECRQARMRSWFSLGFVSEISFHWTYFFLFMSLVKSITVLLIFLFLNAKNLLFGTKILDAGKTCCTSLSDSSSRHISFSYIRQKRLTLWPMSLHPDWNLPNSNNGKALIHHRSLLISSLFYGKKYQPPHSWSLGICGNLKMSNNISATCWARLWWCSFETDSWAVFPVRLLWSRPPGECV